MKKILTGFLGLFVVLGIVAGTGYALFSDTAEMTGTVLGTATPNLQITYSGLGYWTTAVNGRDFTSLLPKEYEVTDFYLRNISNGVTFPLDFDLTAKISEVNGDSDWLALREDIKVRICEYAEGWAYKCNTNHTTGFHTLREWRNNTYKLDSTLSQDAQKRYVINYYLNDVGNEVSGLRVDGIAFEFTGTQIQ